MDINIDGIGVYLFLEGEKVDHLLVVLEGVLALESSSGEKSTRIIRDAELYGESWFLNRPASISIRIASATCTVVILKLDSEISELFTKDPLFKDSSSMRKPKITSVSLVH